MKGNIEAVVCEFKYSRAGTVFIAAASACTVALVAATPLSVALRAALVVYLASIAVHAWVSLRRVRTLSADIVGHIEIESSGGGRLAGSVRSGSFVAPWLTIVRWRTEGGRWDRTLVVLPDMLHPEDFRRLRVILRWSRVGGYCGSGSSHQNKSNPGSPG